MLLLIIVEEGPNIALLEAGVAVTMFGLVATGILVIVDGTEGGGGGSDEDDDGALDGIDADDAITTLDDEGSVPLGNCGGGLVET